MGYDVFEILSPDRYMTEVEVPLPSNRNKSGHAPPNERGVCNLIGLTRNGCNFRDIIILSNKENIILFDRLSRVGSITITRTKTRIVSAARRKSKVQDEAVQN
jgi:hypothetical protein